MISYDILVDLTSYEKSIWASQANIAQGVGVYATFGKGLVCDTVRLTMDPTYGRVRNSVVKHLSLLHCIKTCESSNLNV